MKEDALLNLKIIELIRPRPTMYDTKHPDYHNRMLQDEHWTSISAELGEDIAEAKQRWRNIRDCYFRYVKSRTNTTSLKRPRRPYYLAKYLDFLNGTLRETTKHQPVPLNIKKEEDSETGTDEEQPIEYQSSSSMWVDAGDQSLKEDNLSIQAKRARPEEDDPDLAFMYSLLPDIKSMDPSQKRQFKIGALQLVSKILGDSENI